MNSNNNTLARIADMDSRLRNLLGITEYTSYPWPYINEKDFFPSITPAAAAKIEAGERTALAATIDHTLLKADASPAQIDALTVAALEHKFYSVCVNGAYCRRAANALAGSAVKLAVVVGFPLGQMSSAAKAAETSAAVNDGATEIDMVLNVGLLKAGEYALVLEDIRAVTNAAGAAVPVKVIIETCLLNDDEKIAACLLSLYGGAAFVKTSTGFGSGGATRADIALMRAVVGDKAGVKASGGVRTHADAIAMLKAGANRIGTSNGVSILEGR